MSERTTRFRDDPWQRLPWVLPLAVVVTILSQMGFLFLLRQAPNPAVVPRQVSVEIVELPVSVSPPAARPMPPPTAARRPPPPSARVEQPARDVAPPRTEAPVEPPPSSSPPAASEAPPAQASAPAAPAAPSAPSSPSAPPTAPAEPPVASLPPSQGPPDARGGTDSMSARAIYKPMPEIPESLRRRTLELVAVARFRVTASGAAAVELVEPTSDPDLNRALLDTLGRWRFFPAMRGGKPITSTIDIRIPISVR